MELIILLTALVIVFIGIQVINSVFSGKKYPPGPIGIPILGYAPFVKPRAFVAFRNLAKHYGDIMWVKMGSENLLVLNSYEAVREAFVRQGDIFSSRPLSLYRNKLTRNTGIIFTEGHVWQDHRRFALRTLRDCGFAKSNSVDIIQTEIQHLRSHISSICGKAMDTGSMFLEHTSSIICSLSFGSRTEDDDSERRNVLKYIRIFSEDDGGFIRDLPHFLPIIMKLPLVFNIFEYFNGRLKHLDKFYAYIRQQVKEHEAQIDECGGEKEPEDFLDALILHKRQLDQEGTPHNFTEWSMIRDIFELFFAGTDTSSLTLSWACVFLSLHPDVQRRVQEEIRGVLGPDRLPNMTDRKNLPYTSATLDEVARLGSIAPGAVPHRANQETKLLGFDILPNMVVYPNIYAVHREKKLWKSPEHFDPGNFLDAEGKYKASEFLIPFSIGKRSCLGESLARMELFLFFTAIFQRFKVTLKQPVDMDHLMWGSAGLNHRPGHHEITFEKLDDYE